MKSMRLHQSHKFKIITVDTPNKLLLTKNFTLKYSMFSVPDPSDVLASTFNQNAAYMKISFFVSALDDSLLYTQDDLDIVQRFFADYDNNFIVLPDISDTTLLEALHCKFNVLARDATWIDTMSLTDDDKNLTYDLMIDDDSFTYNLPEVKDWLGELSFWEEAWWNRYDICTFDNVALNEEELAAFKETESIMVRAKQDLDDIDQELREVLSGNVDSKAEVIDLENFKTTSTKWKPIVVE